MEARAICVERDAESDAAAEAAPPDTPRLRSAGEFGRMKSWPKLSAFAFMCLLD